MGRFLLYRSESPDVVLFVGSARVFAAKFLQQRVNAVMVGADSFFLSRRDQLVGLAARHALPAIYFLRECGNLSGNVHRSRHALSADTIREMHLAFRRGAARR